MDNMPQAHAQPSPLRPLAQAIRQTGWCAPALYLLTAVQPLSWVGRQLLLLSQPLLGDGALGRYAGLLRQPYAWDELAALLAGEVTPEAAP